MTAAGVLYGREVIDAVEYHTHDEVTGLLQRIARSWPTDQHETAVVRHPGGVSVNRRRSFLPRRITALGPSGITADIISDDHARRRLARLVGELNGLRALVVALAEQRVLHRRADGHLLPADADRVALEALRQGVDALAAKWPTPGAPLSDSLV